MHALLTAIAVAVLPQSRIVAITIDDLPAGGAATPHTWRAITTGVLDALRRHDAVAVGFVNERKLEDNGALDSSRVALLQAWLDAGHELGNHTFAHRGAHATPLQEYLEGIERGDVVTRALTTRAGRPLRWFRHPQLHTGRTPAYQQAVAQYLARRGYTPAPVTVDNQEWLYARAYAIARERHDSSLTRRIVADYLRHMDDAFAYSEALSRRLFDREIPLVLLLHANELNRDYLDTLLARMRRRGYRFAPLDAVLRDPAYASADRYTGPTGPSWLIRWALTRGVQPGAEPREDAYIAALQR